MKQIAMGIILLAGLLSQGCLDDRIKETKDTITELVSGGIDESKISPKARRLKKACESGDTKSCFEIRSILPDRDTECEYDKLGVKNAVLACENGNIEECNTAARYIKWPSCDNELILDEYYDDKHKDYSKFYGVNILSIYEKACLGGMEEECSYMGEYYEADEEYDQAIKYYRIGCNIVHSDYDSGYVQECCSKLEALQ